MNECTWEIASITTTSSVDDCPTPTLSNMSDPSIKEDSSTLTIQSVEHHPRAGKHFMIRERQEPHRIITLIHGQLKFLDEPYFGGGWLWKCVKKCGWYGFQNTVSGTLLGHDSKGKIHARMSHHQSHEYFMAERHEDGGYVLLTIHGNELWQVAISEDGKSLEEQKAGAGTAWEFINDSCFDFRFVRNENYP